MGKFEAGFASGAPPPSGGRLMGVFLQVSQIKYMIAMHRQRPLQRVLCKRQWEFQQMGQTSAQNLPWGMTP